MKKILFFVIVLSLFITPMTSHAIETDFLTEGELQELEQLQEELGELQIELESLEQMQAHQTESKEIRATVTKIISEERTGRVNHIVFIADDTYTIDTRDSYLEGLRYKIKEGTEVYLQVLEIPGGETQVFLVDVVRTKGIVLLLLLFSLLIIAIGKWRGFSALIGLGLTIIVLFSFIFPQILKGMDPVLATVLGSIVILAINMHLSHGFNKRTLYAYAATLCGLALAVVFSFLFVSISKLSGFASEEAILLYFQSNMVQVPSGILLAGFILGAVGVLDDIAITQSETVEEIALANSDLDRKELFKRAIRIGRHHIASTVNTLVLAYAGVAMPLFLLFMMTQEVGFVRFLNDELIAEEIIRTLAGTSALVLTVPISTWLATIVAKKRVD